MENRKRWTLAFSCFIFIKNAAQSTFRIRRQLCVISEVVTKRKKSKLVPWRVFAAVVFFTDHPTLYGCCDVGGVTLLFVDTKTWRGNNGEQWQSTTTTGGKKTLKSFQTSGSGEIHKAPAVASNTFPPLGVFLHLGGEKLT